MIISRYLARKRVAAGMRPSFRQAWLPVLADTAAIGLVLSLIFLPVVSATLVMELSLVWRMVVLFVVIYMPLQIVVIFSTVWAVRSRYEEKDDT